MSFALEIKQEVSNNQLKSCCTLAQLSALIQLCCTVVIRDKQLSLLYKSENPTSSKRFLSLIKSEFDVQTQLSMIHKMNLKKNNIYQIYVNGNIMEILEKVGLKSSKGLLDCPLGKIVHKDCCARAYLAGAFIASGSINNPINSNYHLEIVCEHENHANFIMRLMNRYYLNAKITNRKDRYVVYVKQAEKIGDFIRLISADESVLKFEDIRIQRDFKNTIQRLDNCDLANEVKIQQAANNQIKHIQSLFDQGIYDKIDDKLKQVIDVRIKYPDSSLSELCIKYEDMFGQSISKSGLKHRFDKIDAIIAKGENYEK